MMDNGTAQATRWYSNSKKLVILFSQPPVLRVAECGNKGKAKVPFTSAAVTNRCNKSNYGVTAGSHYQGRPDGEDGWGQITPLCREYTCSRVFPKAKPLGTIPAGTIIGPISEVLIVKILAEHGVQVVIPSICKLGDVTYVVISRETELFVNEIHTHEAKKQIQ